MRLHLAAALIALTPLSALAQTETAAPPLESPSLNSPLLLTVGIVGGVVVADILTKGALSGPALRVLGLRAAPAAVAAPVVAPVAAPAAIAVAPVLPRPWWRFW